MIKLLLALFLSAVPASAIELSLEENRAERGNIGYIDMRRVFQLFPETQRAKESFEETVRQTEEQVNLRKAELLRLRAELSRMKADREVLAAAPPPPPPAPAPKAPTPALPPKAAPKSAPLAPPATGPVLSTLPGFNTASSAPVQQPLAVELPGGATAPALVSEPALTAPPPAEIAAAPTPASLTPLQMIDDRIAAKTAEVSLKESEYKQHMASAETNLLDLESRKSEVLLGKIYKAVQEVARKEGVSVVVDKGAILYGHNAVDLTDKVLKHLKGA
jgi:Skp family chaperone for outer membrane proteins